MHLATEAFPLLGLSCDERPVKTVWAGRMTETTHEDAINYELLVEDSLRTVVRSALAIVAHEGLPGDTHFYISFKTHHEDVKIDKSLRAANPDEMTIVLQHQFWDLEVTEFDFSVGLSFSGVQHMLKIPFAAVTHFTDPSVGFGLQFSDPDSEEAGSDNSDTSSSAQPLAEIKTDTDATSPKSPADADSTAADSAEIVSLDHFRKKSDSEG